MESSKVRLGHRARDLPPMIEAMIAPRKCKNALSAVAGHAGAPRKRRQSIHMTNVTQPRTAKPRKSAILRFHAIVDTKQSAPRKCKTGDIAVAWHTTGIRYRL